MPIFSARLLVLCALLLSCSHPKTSLPEANAPKETVAALSFLGDELVVDVISRSLLSAREATVDISPWKLDQRWRELFEAAAGENGKEFRAFALDPAELERVLSLRENRWKKTMGKYNQALLDLLFKKAEEQGIQNFFLLTRRENADKFPLHKGPTGVYCFDRKQKTARAYAYFVFDFSYWSVAAKKKIFQAAVDPGFTQQLTFADCKQVAGMKDHVAELEVPVREAQVAVELELLSRMGWKKPSSPGI